LFRGQGLFQKAPRPRLPTDYGRVVAGLYSPSEDMQARSPAPAGPLKNPRWSNGNVVEVVDHQLGPVLPLLRA